MIVFEARCLFPGKEFESQRSNSGKVVSALFQPLARPDTEENRKRVNCDPGHDGPKATRLKELVQGEIYLLAVAGFVDGENGKSVPYYDILEFDKRPLTASMFRQVEQNEAQPQGEQKDPVSGAPKGVQSRAIAMAETFCAVVNAFEHSGLPGGLPSEDCLTRLAVALWESDQSR